MNRRTFITSALAAGFAAAFSRAAGRKPLRILLRSSWQTVNIGDIAHTPGMLALLEARVAQLEGDWEIREDGIREGLFGIRVRLPSLNATQRSS